MPLINPSMPLLFLFFNLGTTECIVILIIILLFIGSTKLPALAKGIGQSIREFKNVSREPQNRAEEDKSKKC